MMVEEHEEGKEREGRRREEKKRRGIKEDQ
jgi:hypothetical protein